MTTPLTNAARAGGSRARADRGGGGAFHSMAKQQKKKPRIKGKHENSYWRAVLAPSSGDYVPCRAVKPAKRAGYNLRRRTFFDILGTRNFTTSFNLIKKAGDITRRVTIGHDLEEETGFEAIGWIDYIDNHRVAGWVWNKNDPADRLNVVVRQDGVELSEIKACAYRSDLEKAGIGDGRYSFDVRFVQPLPNEALISVSVEVKGAGHLIPVQPTVHTASRIFRENGFNSARGSVIGPGDFKGRGIGRAFWAVQRKAGVADQKLFERVQRVKRNQPDNCDDADDHGDAPYRNFAARSRS